MQKIKILRQTLFETKDMVNDSINHIKKHEPDEGYYLAFSGGKDSIVIYELAKMAGVKFDAHYNLTTVDPPELVKFIRKEYPDVKIERPKKSMWELIIENRIPPTRKMRYCCKHLKEKGGHERWVITGIRWQESWARKKRKMIEKSIFDPSKTFLHPIIDWDAEEVWQFIKQNNIPYCKLYDEGYTRLGCVMCPMKGKNGMLKDAKRWPKIVAQYKRTFEHCVKRNKRDGINRSFNNGEDMYNWWINYDHKKVDDAIDDLFERK